MYRLLYALVLQRVPVELAHRLGAGALRALARLPVLAPLLARRLAPRDPLLRVDALGLSFASPLGVAAGLDKDGTWLDGLALLGFGFIEAGTVTVRPQPGNAPPRLLRLTGERALWNRLGFPNTGAAALAARLRTRPRGCIVGANVGKGAATPVEDAVADYVAAVSAVAPVADYIVVNVSSPNTPGLRSLQDAAQLAPLLHAIQAELGACGRTLPLLVKIAPDLDDEDIDAVADLALACSLAGIVAVNTTARRDSLRDASPLAHVEGGGISGAPLRPRALEVLARLHRRVGGRLVLISVGGIGDADDAWERIRAGATLVQAYTGFVYGGPLWPARINRELARRARAAGASSLAEVIGTGAPAPAEATDDGARSAPTEFRAIPRRTYTNVFSPGAA